MSAVRPSANRYLSSINFSFFSVDYENLAENGMINPRSGSDCSRAFADQTFPPISLRASDYHVSSHFYKRNTRSVSDVCSLFVESPTGWHSPRFQ